MENKTSKAVKRLKMEHGFRLYSNKAPKIG